MLIAENATSVNLVMTAIIVRYVCIALVALVAFLVIIALHVRIAHDVNRVPNAKTVFFVVTCGVSLIALKMSS
jgi:uncharacterized membrane protein YhaH (DUF805 family)